MGRTKPKPYVQGPFAFSTCLPDGTVAYVVEDRGHITPCWVWKRRLTTNGYARWYSTGYSGAHRYAYEAVNGPIASGMQLDHLCRVRACVNPDHLEPVTNAVNTQRGDAASLTAETAEQIRREWAAGSTRFGLAERWGVHPHEISRVVRGLRWRNAGGPIDAVDHRIRLTDEQVAQVRAMRRNGSRLRDVAAHFNVSESLVSMIARGMCRGGGAHA